ARFWLERAVWADLVPAQIEARRRVGKLVPEDLDNRFELAELLEFSDDGAGALSEWRRLVAIEGIRSRAVPRLVDALFALSIEDEALEWLQRLAADPEATTEQRVQAADELFFRRSYDRARVLYAAVLEREPDHEKALLHLGQIAAWTNDPRAALPMFARRLAVTDADAALVRFYLGETLWTLGETDAARAAHEAALSAYRAMPEPDFTARSCMATMLARLGHRDAATAAYRDLVARSPRDVDLVLDYADMVLQTGDIALVRALAAHAAALAPGEPRVLRLDAAVAARTGDFAGADRAFERILAAAGSDATVLGDQCQLRLEHGDWAAARCSITRWLEVQPHSLAAQRAEHTVHELLADVADAEVHHRRIGGDRMTSIAATGTWMLDERHWLQGRLAAVSQRGMTTSGNGAATADYARIDAAFGIRPWRSDRLAFGLSAAPGCNGDTPVGAFAVGNFEWKEPVLSLQLRLGWHELWDEPLAAAGLGGRRTSIESTSHLELGNGYWASAYAGVDRLDLDPSSGPHRSDLRWRGSAALGFRIVDGDIAMASRFDPLTVPAGPDSPFLAAEPDTTRPWLCNAWVGWQTAHLLGDADLTGALPLLRRDDHLTGSVRVDHHVARAFGLSTTGYAGIDTNRGSSVYGLEAGVTWRPAFGTEVTLAGSHGAALGRSDGSHDRQLHLQVVLRW
ncbi:MAG: tetratricopeptide repeat protein, partial [Planctomycetes bacterium]|nr:tetratricopeptide repeat protein [Planctomycetota bacterium]